MQAQLRGDYGNDLSELILIWSRDRSCICIGILWICNTWLYKLEVNCRVRRARLWWDYPPVLPSAEWTYLLYNLTDCGVCFPHIIYMQCIHMLCVCTCWEDIFSLMTTWTEGQRVAVALTFSGCWIHPELSSSKTFNPLQFSKFKQTWPWASWYNFKVSLWAVGLGDLRCLPP